MTPPIMPTRILVVGSGGREHALAWKLAHEPGVNDVIVAPGNDGIAQEPRVTIAPDVDPLDAAAIGAVARAHAVELIVIGPEAPLVDGLADNLRTMGFGVFGPNTGKAAPRKLSARPSTSGASGPITMSPMRWASQSATTAA